MTHLMDAYLYRTLEAITFSHTSTSYNPAIHRPCFTRKSSSQRLMLNRNFAENLKVPLLTCSNDGLGRTTDKPPRHVANSTKAHGLVAIFKHSAITAHQGHIGTCSFFSKEIEPCQLSIRYRTRSYRLVRPNARHRPVSPGFSESTVSKLNTTGSPLMLIHITQLRMNAGKQHEHAVHHLTEMSNIDMV